MKLIDFFGRCKVYFDRGYRVYLGFPLSIINITIISYNFVFKNFVFIPEYLKRFYIFAPIVTILILIFGIVLGNLDYKYGLYKSEVNIGFRRNPNMKRLENKIDKILERLDNENKNQISCKPSQT